MTENAPLEPTNRRPRNWQSIKGNDNERASRALSRLEDVTRLVAAWVWEVDKDGKLSFVSERIYHSLGIHPLTCIGKKLEDLGVVGNNGENCESLKFKEPFRHIEYSIQNTHGKSHIMLLSGLPIYNKDTWEYEGACGIAEDVTEIREAQEQLKTAKSEAEKANIAKSQFLSAMSHELRTPLNSILGFSNLLKTGKSSVNLSEKQISHLSHILKAGSNMLELVNDILDLARIESGNERNEPELFKPREVFKECFDMLKPIAEDNSITMTGKGETEKFVYVDKAKLKQVLMNLLGNAIKYNKKDGTVYFGCRDLNDEIIEIYVQDTGIGMSKEDVKAVFQPFYRAHSIQNVIQGSGVGLTLVEKHLKTMGGSITLNSCLGEGTTFIIHLKSHEG